jgi:hypothetical protein
MARLGPTSAAILLRRERGASALVSARRVANSSRPVIATGRFESSRELAHLASLSGVGGDPVTSVPSPGEAPRTEAKEISDGAMRRSSAACGGRQRGERNEGLDEVNTRDGQAFRGGAAP